MILTPTEKEDLVKTIETENAIGLEQQTMKASLKSLPYMFAAMASLKTSKDNENLPSWAKRIITRIQQPPPLNFDLQYASLPDDEEDVELTKKDKAVIKLAKIELQRLFNRIKACDKLNEEVSDD